MPDLMPGYAVEPPEALPYPETENEYLDAIMQNTGGYSASGGGSGLGSAGPSTVNVMGFLINRFDKIVFTYYDTGNTNIQRQEFQLNGTTVSTLTYAYIGNPVTTADLAIQAIAQS